MHRQDTKRSTHGTGLSPRPSVCVSVCPESVWWQNGWMDPDAIWSGEWGGCRHWCIRWGPRMGGATIVIGGTMYPNTHECGVQEGTWFNQPTTERYHTACNRTYSHIHKTNTAAQLHWRRVCSTQQTQWLPQDILKGRGPQPHSQRSGPKRNFC